MKAHDEGYKDFKQGQISNPYKAGSKRHRDWQIGFDKAYFNNLQRVKENEARRGSAAVSSKETSATQT